MTHSFTIESLGPSGPCRAACSCGWTSTAFASAGLAGSAWDEHQASGHEVRRVPSSRRQAPRPAAAGRRAYDGAPPT